MPGGIVKRERLIVMHPPLRNVSRKLQRRAHKAMPNNEWDCGSLLVCKRQKLHRQIVYRVGIERYEVRNPETVEDREQQQRIFRRLAERLGLFDQQTRPFHSGLFHAH